MSADLARTPLFDLHQQLGARMVDFAGYQMPVHYQGIIAEHLGCRSGAALFDVSHMGQLLVAGDDAAKLETLIPSDIAGLAPGHQRYGFFTNDQGGMLDDLMIGRRDDGDLLLVVNAATKAADLAHLRRHGVAATMLDDRALLALQGPRAAAILAGFSPEIAAIGFMTTAVARIAGVDCWLSRSGYCGEDGFEISLPATDAEGLARALLAAGAIPAGLGARDSLRLEAGLCLYGHDIDPTTSPVEAGLSFAIAKSRRTGGFLGADIILDQLEHGPQRRRVGLKLSGRQPAREGAEIVDPAAAMVGRVTSGGYAPSLGAAIAMGYVATPNARIGATLDLMVRDRPLPAEIVKLPFVPHRYHR